MGRKILIATYGSRGDVEPFLALAIGLKARGQSVALLTSSRFSGWIRQWGIEALEMSDAALAQIETEDGRAMLDGGTPFHKRIRAARRLTAKAGPLAEQMIEDTWRAAQAFEPEMIVFHPKLMAAPHIAEKMAIPAVLVFLQPMFVPTRAFPAAGMPELPLPGYNRLSYRLVSLSFGLYRKQVNRFRSRLGLKPVRAAAGVLSPDAIAPIPVIHPISPHVIPRPADWPEHALMTGDWRLPPIADFQPDPDLAAFIAKGPPPVYIGFGSMPTSDPAGTGRMIVKALRLAGQRGIIASGWGGMAAEEADDIHRIESAPHEWLFPKMAAVVHHGGAGSTAAGFHAGAPSVICPFGVDQPFWAKLSVKLGVGARPVPRRTMTAERLASSIRSAVEDPRIRRQARELGEKLRAEDGIGEAATVILSLLERPGQAGRS